MDKSQIPTKAAPMAQEQRVHLLYGDKSHHRSRLEQCHNIIQRRAIAVIAGRL